MNFKLVSQKLTLQQFPGKGGWTYVQLPTFSGKEAIKPFPWMKVNGRIDGYEITNATLMPMGNGTLFLPVKSEIRKAIGKQLGQEVLVELFAQQKTTALSDEEILICIKEEPKALAAFASMPEGKKKDLFAWINEGKDEDQKVERIAKAIRMLPANHEFWR